MRKLIFKIRFKKASFKQKVTFTNLVQYSTQGFVKGEVFCLKYPYFYF